MNETPRDIARLLAQDVERVCLELLPQGKKVGHEWCVGSLEGEAGNSLKVRLTGPKAGLWADFAGTERGDLLNLWVDVRKEGIGRAMREAKEFLGIVDSEPYRYSDKEYQRPKRMKAWKLAKPDSPVMAYLKSRGLTEETIKAFKISEMDGNLPPFDKLPNNPGTIVFPSLRPDENGEMELVSVKYLALYREPAKDGSNNHKKFTQLSGANFEPVLFGWQALDKDTRKVSLSEGEVDCATLHQWGIPALSLPMGGGGGNKQQWVEREYPLLERFDEIFLCLDMDKAGQEATNELIERLGRHRCRVVKLPYKDSNECLMKGVTKDEIMECFRKSAFVAPAELKTAKEFRDKVHQFLHPPTAAAIGQSLPWSYTFAQDRFAFRPKQVSIWSGYNGHGKTTMLSYCMMHAINCGQVCCMASLEIPGEITVLKAVRQTSCKEIPDDDELDASLNWLGDRLWIYDHIGDQKLKEVLDVLLYARRRYGATQLIIDSLMMLSVDGDDYNEQARITKKLKEFARDHNCHIHMVVHPKKAKERGQTPDSSDVKGTGTQTDAVDNVLLVWLNKKKLMAKRDQQLRGIPMPYDLSQEPDATLTIDKNRMTGWTAVIPLWFNDASCQYLSDPNDFPILYAPCSRIAP